MDEIRALQSAINRAGSQKAFAEKAGVSQQYLSEVLNGRKEMGPLLQNALGIERVVTYRKKENPNA
jgi:DNA-binding transcriptional regulator YdaS (Cro superfamily)